MVCGGHFLSHAPDLRDDVGVGCSPPKNHMAAACFLFYLFFCFLFNLTNTNSSTGLQKHMELINHTIEDDSSKLESKQLGATRGQGETAGSARLVPVIGWSPLRAVEQPEAWKDLQNAHDTERVGWKSTLQRLDAEDANASGLHHIPTATWRLTSASVQHFAVHA